MGRMMVIGRKGAAPPVVDDAEDEGPEASEAMPDSDGGEDDGTVECPNCACAFDPESGDVVEPGKPVEGGPESPEGYQGADLSPLESSEPIPGKAGGAHDAAVGDAVMAALMGGPASHLGRAR